MRIIDITHPPKSLWVGRESENTFRPVSFECANWFSSYPNATIAAYYQPYGVSDPYPLYLTVDGTKRIWNPLAAELVKGDGELQIVLMNGDTVGTSAIIPTEVDRSLISNADHPASEAPSWAVKVVQDVTEQADRAEDAVASIDSKVETSVNEKLPEAVEDYFDEHPVVVDETDPTVPAWAKQPTKPTYTAQEVGALPSSYTPPVTSVNGMTGDVIVETGGGAVDSVNGKTGIVVLDAGDVHALPDTTVIPAAVTEQTVSGWGFTKNNGTYSKPSTGIPKSDLAQAVQTSLDKADTALQYAPVTSVNGKTGAVVLKTSDLTNDSGYQTAPFEIPISGDGQGNYTTTATAQDIYDNAENCVIVFGIYRYAPTRVQKDTSNESANILIHFAADIDSTLHVAEIQIHAELPSTITIAAQDSGFFTLPTVTASDNGKFLRVVSGAWAAETVQTWQGGSY